MISTNPKDQFRTPQSLFDHYDAIHHFTLDGCAGEVDHLCPRWWGPGGEHPDILETPINAWKGQTIWINPPYSMTADIVGMAYARRHVAANIVMLLPAWPDRKWWHDYVWDTGNYYTKPDVFVDFLKGRPKFLNPDGSLPPSGGKFPSCIVEMVGDVI